jgi:hypothetical protein
MKNTEKLSGARSFFAESMLKITQRRFNKLGHVDMDDSLEKLGYMLLGSLDEILRRRIY